jgi:5S rRNA maturation endonuclease (ribonuclease M5)
MTIKEILSRLRNVKETAEGWLACCPGHEDRKPSLSISEGDDGRVLLYCHAKCALEAITSGLGITTADLFDKEASTSRPAAPPKASTKKAAPAKDDEAYATADAAQKAYGLGRPTTVHKYLDEHGVHVSSVIRWDPPNRKKVILPVSLFADGWRKNHMPAPRPLLDRRRIVETAGRVYVVEGEKCFDAASGLGLVATTSINGSGAAKQTDWRPLAGREVVILPDNDDSGRKYAEEISRILHGIDETTVVKIVEIEGLEEDGGDVADLVEACWSDDERAALREKIERLADEAAPLQAEVETNVEIPSTASTTTVSSTSTTSSPIEAYRPFPVDSLPEPLRSFVAEAAAAIGCDEAYLGLPVLAVAGAAIGTTRRLGLKGGYAAPPILWTVIVGESGTAKTPALSAVLDPVREHEARLREEHRLDLDDYELAVETYEKSRAAWRSSKASDVEQPRRPAEPAGKRALVVDSTVEALAVVMADNARGLLLARDELAGWLGAFDRYAGKAGGGSDEAFYLSSYNGIQHDVDRRTGDRRTIHVRRAALSITGGIQPAVLRRALGAERRESGLLARLLLAAPPPRPQKWTEAEVSIFTRQAYSDLLSRLYALAPDLDAEGREAARLLRLSYEAKKAWIEFHDLHADELADLAGDLAAAWSKLRDTAVRIALIIHETKLAAGQKADEYEVDADTMRQAITLVEWLKYETRRVYGILGESEVDRSARQADEKLVSWLRRRGGSATAREAVTGCRWIETSDEAKAALDRLEAAGAGSWEDRPAGERGGKPTRVFTLTAAPLSAIPRETRAKEGIADADTADAADTTGAEASGEFIEI